MRETKGRNATQVAEAQRYAAEHGVDLRTAALQFAAAPDVVAAVIPGGRSPEQIRANAASMTGTIPVSFWDALRRSLGAMYC